MTLSIMKENRWTSPGATHNPLREASAVTGNSGTGPSSNAAYNHAGNQTQGRVWQFSTPPRWQSDTSRVWQYSTPPRWQSVPRVAGSTLRSPGPVLQCTRCGLRRNRVAQTHANYSQRHVWQSTLAISAACGKTTLAISAECDKTMLAISAACGKPRWQSVPRVATHAGNQCRVWQTRWQQCRVWQ